MIRVVYISTKNRISPFVAMVGHWPDRAAMVKTARSGKTLGSRPAIAAEIELLQASPRHVAITWGSVRDMLWTHRSPDLEKYYPGLVAAIRKHRNSIKQNLAIVEKKAAKNLAEKAADRKVAADNKARAKAFSRKDQDLFETA